jgi:hypothetical protein
MTIPPIKLARYPNYPAGASLKIGELSLTGRKAKKYANAILDDHTVRVNAAIVAKAHEELDKLHSEPMMLED